MTTGIVRFIEEEGKILAVVDPFQITTREEAVAFYESVLVACVKEMSNRGIGEAVAFPIADPLLLSNQDVSR
jgi:hypothetical protein